MRQTSVNNADLFLFIRSLSRFSSNIHRSRNTEEGKKEEMRVNRECRTEKEWFAKAFINIAGPPERRRTMVMINLGNERHFSAGQTVADNVCASLETAVLGMCRSLYENLNSPARQIQNVTHKHSRRPSVTQSTLWFHQCHDHQVSMTKSCSLIKIAIIQSLAIENKAQGSEIKHWQNTHNLERPFSFEALSKRKEKWKQEKKEKGYWTKKRKMSSLSHPHVVLNSFNILPVAQNEMFRRMFI